MFFLISNFQLAVILFILSKKQKKEIYFNVIEINHIQYHFQGPDMY